jgi:N-acetylmuramoyl-L-alanine amidase
MRTLFKILFYVFMLAGTLFAGQQSVTAPPDMEETHHRRYVVVIDAGHGGGEWGVNMGGVYEKDINLKLARLIADKLEKSEKGILVFLTRNSDAYLKEEERAGIANNKRADVYVSIHCDYEQAHTGGYKVYYFSGENEDKQAAANGLAIWEYVQYKHEAENEKFAETIEQYMKSSLIAEDSGDTGSQENDTVPLEDRGTQGTYVEPLVGLDMPAVLIETGNLNNRNNFVDLRNEKIQNVIAYHIKEGIVNYLKGK